jgi:hypothetical protein
MLYVLCKANIGADVRLSFSKGLYPIKDFPAVLGTEAAGVIVALPTDENVLNHPHFKQRGYKVGSKVACELDPLPKTHDTALTTRQYMAWERLHLIFLSHGKMSPRSPMAYLPPTALQP